MFENKTLKQKNSVKTPLNFKLRTKVNNLDNFSRVLKILQFLIHQTFLNIYDRK